MSWQRPHSRDKQGESGKQTRGLSQYSFEDVRREVVYEDVPAHGHVLGECDGSVAVLIAHRHQAVDQVLQLLLAKGELKNEREIELNSTYSKLLFLPDACPARSC